LSTILLVHGDNDCANGCCGEQQGDNFKREYVAANQRDANVVHSDGWDCGLLGQALE